MPLRRGKEERSGKAGVDGLAQAERSNKGGPHPHRVRGMDGFEHGHGDMSKPAATHEPRLPSAGMGVTAHFFAFDPRVYTTPPTMDRWLEWDELDGDPPKAERLHRPWIYDFDCFRELALEHQRVLARAMKAGRGWSLLRWVWY